MRRLMSAALAVLFCFAPLCASAANRIVIYSGQNPSSTESNQQARFDRLAFGTWMRDALGPNLSAGGVYTGLSVVPNGGMYIAAQPTTTNSLGALYQIAQSDPNPVPKNQNGNQLAADPTNVIVQATQGGPSGAIGPLVAPASGLQQYYLVEAQVQTTDTTPQSMMFVASNGSASFQTVNTQRVDQIVYQVKPGTAASSATVPSVDTGWIAIATVLVPSGASVVTSGMIAAQPAFQGFVANGSSVSLTALTLTGSGAGCLQTNSSGVVSSQACTSGLGTVNGTSPISATTSAGVATVSCTICVTSVSATGNLASTGGTTPQVSMTASPTFSNVTAASQTVNGNVSIPNAGTATSSNNYGSLGSLQVENSLWSGSAAVQHIWGITSDTTGNLTFNFDAANKWSLDSSGNVTATKFIGSGAGLTSLPSANLTGVPTASCLGWSAGFTSTACLTGITAGTGMSVGTGASPSVSISPGGVGQTQVANGYVDLSSAQSINGAKTFSTAPSSASGYISGSSTYGATSATVNGTLQAGSSTAPTVIGYGAQIGNQNVDTPLAIQFGNKASTTGSTYIGSNSGNTLNSVSCKVLDVGTFGGTNALCLDGFGNFSIATSMYLPTTGGYFFGNAAGNGQIGQPGSSTTVNGIGCNVIGVAAQQQFWGLCMDGSGNIGVKGNVTAANFISGSRREWKKHITPYRFDALKLVTQDIDYAEYDCKTARCGPVGMHKVGIIANDSAYQVSGKKHDHYDGFAMAAIDGAAIRELNAHFEHLEHRVDGLESMVKRLCHQKKNRKEAACRAFVRYGH